MAAALVDMKRTAADKKAEKERWEGSPDLQDDYPYGLTIRIDNDGMAKLGLTEADFDAGQPVMICGACLVTEDSINIVNGVKRRSMSLQIQKLALTQDGDDGDDAATTLYGK